MRTERLDMQRQTIPFSVHKTCAMVCVCALRIVVSASMIILCEFKQRQYHVLAHAHASYTRNFSFVFFRHRLRFTMCHMRLIQTMHRVRHTILATEKRQRTASGHQHEIKTREQNLKVKLTYSVRYLFPFSV